MGQSDDDPLGARVPVAGPAALRKALARLVGQSDDAPGLVLPSCFEAREPAPILQFARQDGSDEAQAADGHCGDEEPERSHLITLARAGHPMG